MTDRGSQNEVEILAQRVAQHIACPRGNTVSQPGLPNVFLCERNNIAPVQNL
jgi:hypothetical protein